MAVLGLWIAIIVVALLPLLRRGAAPAQPRIASDELVKDPVCGTYVVRSRAVRRPLRRLTAPCASPIPGVPSTPSPMSPR